MSLNAEDQHSPTVDNDVVISVPEPDVIPHAENAQVEYDDPVYDKQTTEYLLAMTQPESRAFMIYLRNMGWDLIPDLDLIPDWPVQRPAPPAAEHAIKKLRKIKINNNSTECTICDQKFNYGDLAKMMPCKHVFHIDCLIPWLNKTNSCPTCKYELASSNVAYEHYKYIIKTQNPDAYKEILDDNLKYSCKSFCDRSLMLMVLIAAFITLIIQVLYLHFFTGIPNGN